MLENWYTPREMLEWLKREGWPPTTDLPLFLATHLQEALEKGWSMRDREVATLERDLVAKDSEVLAVINNIPGAIRVREENGPENIYASLAVSVARLVHDLAVARTALEKINTIRNSIVGLQIVNWSEHIYPLVAALNEAGFMGMEYPDARERFGTMLERTKKVERDLAAARDLVEQEKTHSSDLFEQKEQLRHECDELKKRVAMLTEVLKVAVKGSCPICRRMGGDANKQNHQASCPARAALTTAKETT